MWRRIHCVTLPTKGTKMASFNKVMIMGNLGAKPELRSTKSGTSVTSLRVATNESYTDGDGQRHDKTEWHTVAVWGKAAENCEKYLDKGRTVLVEGRLQTREWEDSDGNKRYSTEIVASSVQFVGGGSGDEKGDAPSKSAKSSAQQAPAGGKGGGKGKGKPQQSFDDDDIPF